MPKARLSKQRSVAVSILSQEVHHRTSVSIWFRRSGLNQDPSTQPCKDTCPLLHRHTTHLAGTPHCKYRAHRMTIAPLSPGCTGPKLDGHPLLCLSLPIAARALTCTLRLEGIQWCLCSRLGFVCSLSELHSWRLYQSLSSGTVTSWNSGNYRLRWSSLGTDRALQTCS